MTTPTENQTALVRLHCEIPYHGELVNGRCETCEGPGTALQPSVSATMPTAGQPVIIMALDSVATGESREVLRLIAGSGDRPAFQTIDGEIFYLDEMGEGWRFPSDGEIAPYRCTVPVHLEGAVLPCGAILGRRRTECCVCLGQRCFGHCGSVDHFPGKRVARGGEGLYEWQTREIGERFFMAQLYRSSSAGLVIVETVSGVPGESHRDVFKRFQTVMTARIAADHVVVTP